MTPAQHLVMLGPTPCASCGRRGSWLCRSCLDAARPAPTGPSLPGVDEVVAAWAYEGGPRTLVLALKLRHLSAAADPLVEAALAAARRARLDGDVITWVPARGRDVSRRGFDHAEVLARGIASGMGLGAKALLRRRGIQADQTQLDRRARMQNLKDAFIARTKPPPRVILVDDLVTTGATAMACARALKVSGASRVCLLTACGA